MNESGLAQPRVSRVLVERYVARIRKRRRWRRLAVTLTVLLLIIAAALYYVVWHTRVLDVRRTSVKGTRVLTVAQVQDVAKVPLHQPLAAVDTQGIKARIMALPRVASAIVERDWPHTILITIVERVPAAAVPANDGTGAFTLVDADGVAFDTAASAARIPPHVPVVRYQPAATPAGLDGVPDVGARPQAQIRAAVIKGALAALRALPPAVRARVRNIAASGPYGIVLDLAPTSAGGAKITVDWGGGDQADLKARVLTALLDQPGLRQSKTPPTHYDVSAPGSPAYS